MCDFGEEEETVIKSRGFVIPKTSQNLKWVQKNFVLTPYIIGDYGQKTENIHLYRFSQKYIYLPKYAALKLFPKRNIISRERNSNIKYNNLEHFNGTLKKHQIPIVKNLYQKINKNDSIILCLGTGYGKTCIALYLISLFKLKSLIIVHKTFLMDQWIERIHTFLPKAKIGTIKQNIVDIENKDIVIGMLQSIALKKEKYSMSIFDQFDFTVVDECHRICSQAFSNALFQISTKKMLGLSATPYRKDGMTKVLKWFMNDIYTPKCIREQEFDTQVFIIYPEYSTKISPKYNYKGKVILANLINQLVDDHKRNLSIISKIIELVKNDNRKILILTDRRNHCITLQNLLIKTNISTGLYLGGMKDQELQETNKKQIIIATYSMAQEGYDCPDLDTLIMATGRTDIQQAVGRILRKINSNTPLIVDIHDSFEGVQQQALKRIIYYKKRKFTILNDLDQECEINEEKSNILFY